MKAAHTESQTVRLGVLVAGLMTRKYLWHGTAPSLAKAQIILQATAGWLLPAWSYMHAAV